GSVCPWASGASVMSAQVKQGPAVGGDRLCSLPGPREGADGAEFADQDPAYQAVVADDDLAVGAAGGVGELHDVVARQRLGLAERGQVEGAVRPGEGEPGQGAGAGVAGGGVPGEQRGERVGLFEGRGGEPVDRAGVLGAVADGVD